MLISQIAAPDGKTVVVAREGGDARAVKGAAGIYELATHAARSGKPLATRIAELGLGVAVNLAAAYRGGRMHLPIIHPDPAHMGITVAVLTHLGPAATRAAMHAATPQKDER